jgi:hypothetical protein
MHCGQGRVDIIKQLVEIDLFIIIIITTIIIINSEYFVRKKWRPDYLRNVRYATQCKNVFLPTSRQFTCPKIGYGFETPFVDVKK